MCRSGLSRSQLGSEGPNLGYDDRKSPKTREEETPRVLTPVVLPRSPLGLPSTLDLGEFPCAHGQYRDRHWCSGNRRRRDTLDSYRDPGPSFGSDTHKDDESVHSDTLRRPSEFTPGTGSVSPPDWSVKEAKKRLTRLHRSWVVHGPGRTVGLPLPPWHRYIASLSRVRDVELMIPTQGRTPWGPRNEDVTPGNVND